MEDKLQVHHLLDGKGAIPRQDLEDFAREHSSFIFESAFRTLFLVGSQIKHGSLVESRMLGNETMSFSSSGCEEGVSLASAIFPLMKPGASGLFRGTFMVGRTVDCDFVMNDFVISKEHALIQVNEQGCFLTDLESTNGTWLDAQRLKPHTPAMFNAGMSLAFGRYEFSVMSAEELHEQLVT
jgi:hypothetical protein